MEASPGELRGPEGCAAPRFPRLQGPRPESCLLLAQSVARSLLHLQEWAGVWPVRRDAGAGSGGSPAGLGINPLVFGSWEG